MAKSLSTLHDRLVRLTYPILDSLEKTNYTPPKGTTVSVKSIICALLKTTSLNQAAVVNHDEILSSLKNSTLALALLITSETSNHTSLSWIPKHISTSAASAFGAISNEYAAFFDKSLVVDLLPEVLPSLKQRIKESSVNKESEGDEMTAASARVPVVHAILAAHQFRWFVTQVESPHLGKLCNLVIPSALTALDHWSPEVKGQGMIGFIHLAENVNAAEFGVYEDAILDACCENIPCTDEIWHLEVEMSVLLVTNTQQNNCRSPWFERMLNEMLSHLERQPRDKNRCIAWLKFIEPLFCAVGLVLLAHFSRIFPLFFKWIHADDDETVLLVLERLQTVIKLTWIRNTPYIDRLVGELTNLYKEAALRKAREEIRREILQILTLLQQCKGAQFETAWERFKDDPNLSSLGSSLSQRTVHV